MEFGNAALLAGMALGAIPVIIHLINRQRAKLRHFAAIEFLLLSDKRIARRLKLKQLLVLARGEQGVDLVIGQLHQAGEHALHRARPQLVLAQGAVDVLGVDELGQLLERNLGLGDHGAGLLGLLRLRVLLLGRGRGRGHRGSGHGGAQALDLVGGEGLGLVGQPRVVASIAGGGEQQQAQQGVGGLHGGLLGGEWLRARRGGRAAARSRRSR